MSDPSHRGLEAEADGRSPTLGRRALEAGAGSEQRMKSAGDAMTPNTVEARFFGRKGASLVTVWRERHSYALLVSRCRGPIRVRSEQSQERGGHRWVLTRLSHDCSEECGLHSTSQNDAFLGRMTSDAFMLRVPPRTMAMHGAGGPWCACMEVRTCFRGWWVCRPSHAERPARSSSKGLARRARRDAKWEKENRMIPSKRAQKHHSAADSTPHWRRSIACVSRISRAWQSHPRCPHCRPVPNKQASHGPTGGIQARAGPSRPPRTTSSATFSAHARRQLIPNGSLRAGDACGTLNIFGRHIPDLSAFDLAELDCPTLYRSDAVGSAGPRHGQALVVVASPTSAFQDHQHRSEYRRRQVGTICI
ncbi:hypothetical protein L1887_50901 [Cichorium endivia]|nr:hypothetical protein L1887_50901 [Cichorium endivia]